MAPGWTVSDQDREKGGDAQKKAEAAYVARTRTPLNRRGTDQEVANGVLFLASDLASCAGTYILYFSERAGPLVCSKPCPRQTSFHAVTDVVVCRAHYCGLCHF